MRCRSTAQGPTWKEQLQLVWLWWMQVSPPWEKLEKGLRPNATFDDDPSTSKHGWQYVVTQPLNARFVEGTLRPRLLDSARAQLSSQSGPLVSAPFKCPVARHTTQRLTHKSFAPCSSAVSGSLYPLPAVLAGLAVHSIPVAGVLGGRGFPVESAAARVCREGGRRVTTNIRIQDMGIVASRGDPRR